MKKHLFRITVEPVDDAAGQSRPEGGGTLAFVVSNHDDILEVVERLRGRGDFTPEAAAAFGVGLKLFGELLLVNREHPLFRELAPQFGQFMKALKSGPGPDSPPIRTS